MARSGVIESGASSGAASGFAARLGCFAASVSPAVAARAAVGGATTNTSYSRGNGKMSVANSGTRTIGMISAT